MSGEYEINIDAVSKACKIICDVLEAREVDKVTAACAMKVLIHELEREGVVVLVTHKIGEVH